MASFHESVTTILELRASLFDQIGQLTEELTQLYADEEITYKPDAELQDEVNALLKRVNVFEPETPDYYESSEYEDSED